jgi:hypothetical protein
MDAGDGFYVCNNKYNFLDTVGKIYEEICDK